MAAAGRRLYFAYGSNMDVEQMGRRCPDARLVGTARLPGYRFRVNGYGVATIVPEGGAVVHGVLWELTEEDERELDEYEGVPDYYLKDVLGVIDGSGQPLEAMVYIARDSEPAAPRRGYMERIVRAARHHGLPVEYVEELASWLDRS
jgi:gamma-glutamylcyclotransferase (GGCT)/AIG2-like uncharacterized protein YtfP